MRDASQGPPDDRTSAPAGIALEPGPLAVVSPHPDDAVLSLGGVLSACAREGRETVVVTALAGDPEAQGPVGGWDARAGFGTEGEAARGRAAEDRRACAILGVRHVGLPFPDAQYGRPRDEEAVVSAVRAAVEGARTILLPGHPLEHADHAWLTAALLRPGALAGRVGLYVEQPYAVRAGVRGGGVGLDPGAWREARPGLRDRLRKVRAVRAYRTQLPLLGLRLGGRLWLAAVLLGLRAGGREAIAWHDADRDQPTA